MPSRNRDKIYNPQSYYHIYNTGSNSLVIFKENNDYETFINLLKRYLINKTQKDKRGREYKSFLNDIELLAFCLMPTHYHLLIYQRSPNVITSFMRRVATSYSTYFNHKYKRAGPLFNERYKASKVEHEKYLLPISRYMHLEPKNYKHWAFSSLPYYSGNKENNWIAPGKVLGSVSVNEYLNFLADRQSYNNEFGELKVQLANSI